METVEMPRARNTELHLYPTVLTDKIEELGEGLRSHFSIEEFSPVSLPAQVHMLYCSGLLLTQ